MHLKQADVKHVPVNLREDVQNSKTYRAQNPAGLVPTWSEPDGFTLGQSLAIIAYLDELYPEPPFLPDSLRPRAICREIVQTIACDIHPLTNLRVQEKLTADYGADTEARLAWIRHWIAAGFDVIETRLATAAGLYAVGDRITLADICLVPQVYSARRYGLDLAAYPRIVAADAAARQVPAFSAAVPEAQIDAPAPS